MENSSVSAIESFEDLQCWQAAREFRRFVVHQILPTLPREERYRLGDQLLRAARSVTANIAEGYGRYHYLDNYKFCSVARGSCYEVLDHLITGRDENLINEALLLSGREHFLRTKRLLNGYMAYLQRQASSKNS